jgi:acyl-CoA thioesterase-2
MDARSFLGMEPSGRPLHWRLPVTRGISGAGREALFGGCGLAAGIVALEAESGRPTIWASAQYLSYAPVGCVLDVEATLAAAGRVTTQGRAVARLDGEEILTVNAALGRRPLEARGTWEVPPEVPPPERSPRREVLPRQAGTIWERLETRLAWGRLPDQLDGTPGDGRASIWARVPGQLEPSAATLAVLGDLVPGGISQALGTRTGGNSLDNTVRVVKLVPTAWVLCDIRIHAVQNGYGHGSALLWAEDGTLLAAASQSVIVRHWRPD